MGNNGRSLLEEKIKRYMTKNGDKNTEFLHKMANAHWRRKYLTKTRVNGEMLLEDVDIKERMTSAFYSLLFEFGA